MLFFPGFIDPHVHIYLPFMGTFAKDTHQTASRAALIGGTTTFIEMICPSKKDRPLDAFELWLGKAQGNSACDFTFHMGVTRTDPQALNDLRQIVQRGVASFKVFSLTKTTSASTTKNSSKPPLPFEGTRRHHDGPLRKRRSHRPTPGRSSCRRQNRPRIPLLEPPPFIPAEGVHHLMTFRPALDAHVCIIPPQLQRSPP